MIAVIKDIVRVRDDIRIIHLQPLKTVSWQAGQYIDISFAGLPPRSYSIANAPETDVIEIHIKRSTGEASIHVMEKLAIREKINFSKPEGNSIYSHDIDDPILAIAGGLGIAPLKAIIDEALKKETPQTITLYWGTVTENEKYLDDHFKTLAITHKRFSYIPVTGDNIGVVATKEFKNLSGFQIYVSGSPPMLSATIPLLLDKNADRAKIGYDQHCEAARVSP